MLEIVMNYKFIISQLLLSWLESIIVLFLMVIDYHG